MKALVAINFALLCGIVFLLMNRSAAERDGGPPPVRESRDDEAPSSVRPVGGLQSQVGGGDGRAEPKPMVDGDGWHLPRQLLWAVVYESITYTAPPRLNAEFCEDLELTQEEQSKIHQAMASAFEKMKTEELKNLEIETDDAGKNVVRVNAHQAVGRSTMSELRSSIEAAIDKDRASLVNAAVVRSRYLERMGEEIVIRLENRANGQVSVIAERGGTTVTAPMTKMTWQAGHMAERLGHLVDLEALGWKLED